ncbi:MAG: EAL domain-containing protein [Candidatus Thiodiazotropha sp.]
MFGYSPKIIEVSRLLVAAVLVVFAYILADSSAIQRIDHLLYDYFLSHQGNRASHEVVIIAIDDSSLNKLGRWPWSRRIHANLLDRLTDMNAKAVGYDVLFPEPELEDSEADQLFANAIRRNGHTVLAVAPNNLQSGNATSELLPLVVLAEYAAGLGHVGYEIDSDGLCRSIFLYAGMDDAVWPVISLALFQVAGEGLQDDRSLTKNATLSTTPRWLRSDRFLIPFDPRPGAIEVLSAYKVLHDDETAQRVKDKLVMVGSIATGLGDFVSTPVSPDHQRMSGVELNAHVLSGLLNQTLIREMSRELRLLLIIAITAIAAYILVSVSFPSAMIIFLGTILAVPAIANLLLLFTHIWFAPSAVVVSLSIGFPLWGAWLHLHEMRINRVLNDQMQHQALHHPATDLPNQYALEVSLRSLKKQDSSTDMIAVLMIMHIKWLNSAGEIVTRSAGNKLLQAIAQRLRDTLRSDDLVTHLGGDDFGVLVKGLKDAESARVIAQNLLNALQEPLEFEGTSVFFAPRMGLSLWPIESSDGVALLRDANIAVFRARIQQSSALCVYSSQIAQEVQKRSQLEQALIFALERNEFEVYYQPQVVTSSGRIIGVEALIRWHNPELGLVYPGTFIPVAEHTGLICAIGIWVLRTACIQAQHWNDCGFAPLRLAVNLSPLQFAGSNLVSEVRDSLNVSGLDPINLELEITESAVMQDMQEATNAMRMLKELGVKLAIDDFGTGYSSLSNLQYFPLDRIKIDQSFTREIQNNNHVREIILAIINMAKRLKLDVIAEGVETESQAEALDECGCDELQGFYFGHPLPAAELSALLEPG